MTRSARVSAWPQHARKPSGNQRIARGADPGLPLAAGLWVPETTRTARDLLVRPRQVARHDPLMALRLIYQVFTSS